jgi:hypothetical protein
MQPRANAGRKSRAYSTKPRRSITPETTSRGTCQSAQTTPIRTDTASGLQVFPCSRGVAKPRQPPSSSTAPWSRNAAIRIAHATPAERTSTLRVYVPGETQPRIPNTSIRHATMPTTSSA